MDTQSFGIENLKDSIKRGLKAYFSVNYAFSEDSPGGREFKRREAIPITIDTGKFVWDGYKDRGEIFEEIKDIDPEEMKELFLFGFQQYLDTFKVFPNDEVKELIKDSIQYAIEGWNLTAKWVAYATK